MIYFRPLPGLTVAALLGIALTVGLGIWQLQRLHWKEALIATAQSNIRKAPLSLDEALKNSEAAQYRHVMFRGYFLHDKEVTAFATGEGGKPLYHVITPFVTDDGRTLLVDRGVVPEKLRDPSSRPAGQTTGEQKLVGVWRTPDSSGLFTPAPDLEQRIFYARDIARISRAIGVRPTADVVVEADSAANPGAWPKGGQTRINFRNPHREYAGTWFLLACALLAVYVAFHISRGRLGLRR